MVLSFRPAVHQPQTIRTVQGGRNHRHEVNAHVGVLSIFARALNLFLTGQSETRSRQDEQIGVLLVLSNIAKDLVDDTSGATAIEYGLILALIAIAIIVAVQNVASTTITMWNTVTNRSVSAMSGA